MIVPTPELHTGRRNNLGSNDVPVLLVWKSLMSVQ